MEPIITQTMHCGLTVITLQLGILFKHFFVNSHFLICSYFIFYFFDSVQHFLAYVAQNLLKYMWVCN